MVKVAAAIFENDGKILFCQRAEGGNCAFLWEFPGGKIEEGETPEKALCREIKEELGIEIAVKELFDEFDFSYPDKDIHFYFLKAEITFGKIELFVHKDFCWLLPEEAKKLLLCPADRPVLKKLLEEGKKA